MGSSNATHLSRSTRISSREKLRWSLRFRNDDFLDFRFTVPSVEALVVKLLIRAGGAEVTIVSIGDNGRANSDTSTSEPVMACRSVSWRSAVSLAGIRLNPEYKLRVNKCTTAENKHIQTF